MIEAVCAVLQERPVNINMLVTWMKVLDKNRAYLRNNAISDREPIQ